MSCIKNGGLQVSKTNGKHEVLSGKVSIQTINYIMWIIFLISIHVPSITLGYVINTRISLSIVLQLFSVWSLMLLNSPFLKKIHERKLLFIISLFFLIITANLLFHWSQTSYFSYFEMFKNLFLIFSFLLVVLIFFSKCDKLNLDIFKRIYINFVLINCFAILFQIFFHYLFNIDLFLFYQSIRYGEFIRPCGFFTEPASFGMFLTGLIFFTKEDFKKYKKIFILSLISLILTTSGIAYIVAVFLFVKSLKYYFYLTFKNMVIILLIISVIFMVSQNFPTFSRIKSAIHLSDNSSVIRVIKGFVTYNSMNFQDKFFGIGAGNPSHATERYVGPFSSLFIRDKNTAESFSGFFYELICFGIIPAIICNLLIVFIVFKTYHSFFVFMVLEVLRLTSGMTLSSATMLLMFLLLIIMGRKNKEVRLI